VVGKMPRTIALNPKRRGRPDFVQELDLIAEIRPTPGSAYIPKSGEYRCQELRYRIDQSFRTRDPIRLSGESRRLAVWGGRDSNLRPTDRESGWKMSVEPDLACRGKSCPGSSAEIGGVGDKFRDKVSAPRILASLDVTALGYRDVMTNEHLIQEAGKRLAKAAPGARVIVFGSRARGEARHDSDQTCSS
jgi:hypothetical protein